jgi:hypothetical protein
VTGKFEIEGKKDCLHVGEDGGECEKPHFDEMGNQAFVWGSAERLVKGTEACVEEVP